MICEFFADWIRNMVSDECSDSDPCTDPRNYCSVCKALAEQHKVEEDNRVKR